MIETVLNVILDATIPGSLMLYMLKWERNIPVTIIETIPEYPIIYEVK